MEHYSLNDLGAQLTEGDLLLECTMTIRVNVSIERPHSDGQDETAHLTPKQEKGWLVSLGLPSSETLTSDTSPFLDGEPQMICDLKYLDKDDVTVRLEDAIKALGIDVNARIWQVKPAP
jgi:hypothetical protein